MDEVKTPSTSGEAVEMAMMHLRSVQQFAAYDQMPEANLNLSVAQVYATMANALPSELQQAAYDGSQYARANVVQGERERLRQLYRDSFDMDDEYFPHQGMEDAAEAIVLAEEQIFGPRP